MTYEPEDSASPKPVRAGRAKARERLLSYREPASRNPQAKPSLLPFWGAAKTRAPFRLLCHPCIASGNASDFLPATALITTKSCDLSVPKTCDASDRHLPLDRRFDYPYVRALDPLPQLTLRGRPHGFWDPCELVEGGDVSRRPPPLRSFTPDTPCFAVSSSHRRDRERGRFVPTAPDMKNL